MFRHTNATPAQQAPAWFRAILADPGVLQAEGHVAQDAIRTWSTVANLAILQAPAAAGS